MKRFVRDQGNDFALNPEKTHTEKYDATASALTKWLMLQISKGVESRNKPLRLKLQATSFLLHLMCICT